MLGVVLPSAESVENQSFLAVAVKYILSANENSADPYKELIFLAWYPYNPDWPSVLRTVYNPG